MGNLPQKVNPHQSIYILCKWSIIHQQIGRILSQFVMIDRWKFTFFPFWIFSLRDFYEFLIFIAAQDFPGQVALFPICGATKGFWRSGSCNFLTRNHDDWSAPKSPQPPQLQDVRGRVLLAYLPSPLEEAFTSWLLGGTFDERGFRRSSPNGWNCLQFSNFF